MNFSSMDYFIVLARERNFSRAAEQLHMTQQSLSAHIASLEQELDCKLFVRHVPLELTYAGERFLDYAMSFTESISSMRQEFCDISANQKGVLRIGIAFTRSRALMPRLIPAFQSKYPNISIELAEDSNATLAKNLLNGEIDLAIANFPYTLQDVEFHGFYDEEVVLLISRQLIKDLYGTESGRVLTGLAAGNLAFLRTCPFLMGNPADIAARIGLTMLKQAKIRPVIRVRSNNIETLLSLCVRSTGACFCPENLARSALTPDQLDSLELIRLGDGAKYPIRFGYLKKTYQWSIILEFIKTALETNH